MIDAETIRERILAALPGADARVADYTGGGDHFRAEVVAPQFTGLSLVAQHRLIYAVVKDELADGSLHALSLSTRAAPGAAATEGATQ